MKAWWLAFWLLAAAACESSKPAAPAGGAPSDKPTVPSINLADQKGVKRPADAGSGSGILPGIAGETDGREIDAGVSFRGAAKQGCPDVKCVGDNCARMCAKWTGDNPPSSAELKNKVYLSCLGTCLMEVDQ